jgi:hypothetical protein
MGSHVLLLVDSLGDMLARWTSTCHDSYSILTATPRGKVRGYERIDVSFLFVDDVFKSTVHRASNPSGEERYSIPLFFGTDYDVRLEVSSVVGLSCHLITLSPYHLTVSPYRPVIPSSYHPITPPRHHPSTLSLYHPVILSWIHIMLTDFPLLCGSPSLRASRRNGR